MHAQDKYLRGWERWGGKIPNYWRGFFSSYFTKKKDGKVRWQSVSDALIRLRPCLVHPENQKVFKILRHIESCGTCMKH